MTDLEQRVQDFADAVGVWQDSDEDGYDGLIQLACEAKADFDALLTARAVAAPARAEREWQEIATAPKSGKVLASNVGEQPYICGWWDGTSQNPAGWWKDAHLVYPTHWMPLPDPPAARLPRQEAEPHP